MRVKEFKSKTDNELFRLADDCFASMEQRTSSGEEAGHLLKAQFYMTAVDRRHDGKIARRDFTMELIVIVLILAEVVFGIVEGNKQAAILDDMKKSTSATATTLQNQASIFETMNANIAATTTAMDKLQKAQADSLKAQQNSLTTLKNTLKSIAEMNSALQKQLALAFEVAVMIDVDGAAKRLVVVNQTKTAIVVRGTKFDGEPPGKLPDEKFIPPGDIYSFFGDVLYKKATDMVPKGIEKSVPLELYLESADGRQYVIRSYLLMKWENDVLKLYPTINSIKQEQWPSGIN